jgi:mono/diheme cytochrome c family protein
MIIPVLAGATTLYGDGPKASPEAGEAIYRQKCGGCHGLDGKGETTMGKNWKMRDLNSPDVQKQPDSELIKAVSNGRGHMPAYEIILGNDKIREVVAYVREMAKK